MRRIAVSVIFAIVTIGSTLVYAKDSMIDSKHALYFGMMGGYGSTTWHGLVPSLRNQNAAVLMSTPIQAREGGGAWGLFVDYEISPYFAIEANYLRFPNASITFDQYSLFAFENNGKTQLTSKTDTISVLAKIMLKLPNSNGRLYSGTGISRLHRKDMLINDARLSPTFTIGMNLPIHPHIITEVSGQYTAGYGESTLNPANAYMPFLYAIVFKLAYVV